MAKNQETQTSSLQDFAFDDDKVWFGREEALPETEQILKEIKQADIVVDEDGKQKPETTEIKAVTDEGDDGEDDDVTFFEEKPKKPKAKTADDGEEEVEVEVTEVKDKKDPKEKEENKEEDDPKFFTTLAAELKERGVFQNIELAEGEEITEEKFFELQDTEIEKRVEETFEAFFEGFDEDAKNFLLFKKNNGKTSDFFAAYSSSQIDLDSFDADDAGSRDTLLTHYLSSVEKLEAEDIADRIKWLKESGKDKIYAEKYHTTLVEDRDNLKASVIEQQEKAAKKREDNAKLFNASLNETLEETESVGAFSFTKDDQKELGTYITKPSVKVGKNKYIPAFQAEIANIFKAETKEDKQKLLLLAKLVKSNFDTTDLATDTQTVVTKKAKSKLQQAKTGVKPSSAGGYAKKALEDYF